MPVPALVLTDAAAAAGIALATQAVMTGGAWEKLVETAPLTAVLLAGLWIVFSSYRGLVTLILQALQENREAMTELKDAVKSLEKKLDSK